MDLVKASELHKKWIDGEDDGVKLDMRHADMSHTDMSRYHMRHADMSHADMSYSHMSYADMSHADMSHTDMSHADMSGADMNHADMRYSHMSYADMSYADMSYCRMSYADMSHADMSHADLSGAVGLEPQWSWVKHNLTQTEHGYICYKTFNETFRANRSWTIAEGSTITENVNFDRCNPCACGINVATLDWVLHNTKNDEIWECLIPFEALAGMCVPYNTEGKFRCEMVKLIKKHTREELLKK